MLLALVLFALSAGFLVLDYQHRTAELFEQWRERLASTADDRQAVVEAIVAAGLEDVAMISTWPSVVDSASSRAHLEEVLDRFLATHDATSIAVFGKEGEVRARAGDPVLAEQEASVTEPTVTLQELGGRSFLVYAAPLPEGGFVTFASDPADSLFPLLRSEATPTRTGETLLARRQGERIHFLTPLRHPHEGTIVEARPDLAAAVGLQNGEVLGTFTDYRGVPVLAATRLIAPTPWVLVAKVDRSEALESLKEQSRSTILSFLSLLLAVAGIGFGIWRHQEASRRAAMARLGQVMKHAADAIFFMTCDGEVLEANQRAIELYGRQPERIQDLHEGEEVKLVNDILEGMPRRREELFEATHRLEDGTTLPVEISCRYLPEQSACLAVVRDISDRKEAERRIDALNRMLRTLTQVTQLTARQVERDQLLAETCRIAVKEGGFESALVALETESGELKLAASQGRSPGRECAWEAYSSNRTAHNQDKGIAAAPIVLDRGPVGALQLQAEAGVFEPSMLGQLQTMAGELAFVLELEEARREKARVEEALRSTESRLKAAKVAGWSWEVETDRLELSHEFEELVAIDPREVTTLVQVLPMLHQDDLPRFLDNNRRSVEDERPFCHRYRMFDGSGRLRWCEFQGETVSREPRRLTGTFRDLTEEVERDETLRLAQRRYEAALSNSPVTVFEQDRDLRYTWVDHAPPELGQVVGRTDPEVFGEAGRILQEFGRSVLRLGKICTRQVEVPIGKETRTFDLTLAPIREHEQVVGLTGVAVDVTERVAAESERRRLSRAIEQSPVSVEITDHRGRIVYVNPAFSRTSGYTAREVLGQNPRIVKSGKTPPEVYRELWQTIAAGDVWTGELLNRRKSGELFWESVTIAPVFDDNGAITHYLAVKEDITDRKRAAAELEETRRQLEQVQKMEAVGRLAGGVAHDFNNLLTVLFSYLELLEQSFQAGSDESAMVAEMRAACSQARGLTTQLLAFSRRHATEPRVVDLASLLPSSLRLLERVIGEDVRLSLSLDATEVHVKIDPIHIEQVLMNLVLNARDAIGPGGRIEVSTDLRWLDEEIEWEGGLLPPGYYGALVVSDDGCGMDDTVRSRLFEPFFTTKPVGKGTGLGLATVFGIVRQNRGAILVESRLGEGTTFQILLPRASAEAEKAAVKKRPKEGDIGKRTVLLVEDQEPLRRLVSRLLHRNGHVVVEAPDAEEAMEAGGQPDLLITDVVLPGVSGLELAARLRQRFPGLAVLFMSGYGETAVAEEEFFLAKPFTPAELQGKLEEIFLVGETSPK